MSRHIYAVDGNKQRPVQQLTDADAEREVLACVLMADSAEHALEILDAVEPEAWGIVRHQHIAKAMRIVAQTDATVEPVTIAQTMQRLGTWELCGGARCLGELLDRAGTVVNWRWYASRVAELARARKMLDCGSRLAAESATRTDELAAVLAETRKALDDIGTSAISEPTAQQRVAEVLARIEHPATRIVRSTGLASVDALLDGGIEPGWLVVVLGAPGQGKTVLACNNLGLAALRRGESVLYVGEMSERELIHRWLAAESGVPLRAQRRGDLTPQQWGDISAAADRMATWRWRCRPISSLANIEAEARSMRLAHGLDVLVVDYVQLVANGLENRVQDIEQTTRGLKLLATELKCVVIAVSQPDKASAKGGELTMHDGKGAGSIAADCDAMLVPLREHGTPRSGLVLAKYRHGPEQGSKLGLGRLTFDGARLAFAEASNAAQQYTDAEVSS